jgi:hypothetical protein
LGAVQEISYVAVLKTKGEIGVDGRLRVDVPVELPAGPIELVVVLGGIAPSNGSKYDFSDLTGRLHGRATPSGNRDSCAMSGERSGRHETDES